jgi:hypothetical protein
VLLLSLNRLYFCDWDGQLSSAVNTIFQILANCSWLPVALAAAGGHWRLYEFYIGASMCIEVSMGLGCKLFFYVYCWH